MEWIEEFLKERKERSLLRELKVISYKENGFIYFNNKKFYDFSSNDYLGLAGHPKLKEIAKETIEKYGTSTSSSRLLNGTYKLHNLLEEKIASFKAKEASIVFNSGYQANLGIISALAKKGDVIFIDRLSHASIVDGVLLSGARFFRFNHNDLNHLKDLLDKNRNNFKNAFIITETIFSMDGDRAPLKEIVKLKEKYNCILMVDEAHATGIFGKTGSGVVEEENLTDNVELIMGTFSKALGGFGAYLACSLNIKKYLINTARSFIYSTSLPPQDIAINIKSIDLIKEEPYRRERLLENSRFFIEKLIEKNFITKSSSQIVPLIYNSASKTLEVAEKLKDLGYWVFAIRPPTVRENECRVRFSLSFYHSKELLEKLVEDLAGIERI